MPWKTLQKLFGMVKLAKVRAIAYPAIAVPPSLTSSEPATATELATSRVIPSTVPPPEPPPLELPLLDPLLEPLLLPLLEPPPLLDPLLDPLDPLPLPVDGVDDEVQAAAAKSTADERMQPPSKTRERFIEDPPFQDAVSSTPSGAGRTTPAQKPEP
jgi:hypothetical protein